MPGGRKKGHPKTGGRKKGTPDKKPRKGDHLFKPGHVRHPNAGRKKGSLNKLTVEGKNKAEQLINMLWEYVPKDIPKMGPTKRMTLMGDLLEYTIPKQARITKDGDQVTEIALTVRRTRKVDTDVDEGG